jgi:hypothetical protein
MACCSPLQKVAMACVRLTGGAAPTTERRSSSGRFVTRYCDAAEMDDDWYRYSHWNSCSSCEYSLKYVLQHGTARVHMARSRRSPPTQQPRTYH